MIKNNIGISIAVNTGNNNLDRFNDLVNLGFKHIEFYNKIVRMRFNDIKILKSIVEGKDMTFSFHSMAQDLFCEDKDIANQEYYTLKGEIKLASLIGCSRVIFHINKKSELSVEEIATLNGLVDYSSNLGVTLVQENNQSGIMSGEYLFQIGEQVPSLKFCLDIGHLNIALNKGDVTDKKEFIEKIASKIVQLHINYNNGQNDEHKELDSLSANYFKQIIEIIGKRDVTYVIETKNLEQAKKTLRILNGLLT